MNQCTVFSERPIPRPLGFLEIWKIGPDGQATLDAKASGPNLVVDTARKIMSRLAGGAFPDSGGMPAVIPGVNGDDVPIITGMPELAVAKMQWGSSNTAPAAGQTALIAPLGLQKPVSVDYPTPMSVRFISILGNADLNGETLREVVLLTHSNLVFARKTFVPSGNPPNEKAYAFTWEFRWTINF